MRALWSGSSRIAGGRAKGPGYEARRSLASYPGPLARPETRQNIRVCVLPASIANNSETVRHSACQCDLVFVCLIASVFACFGRCC